MGHSKIYHMYYNVPIMLLFLDIHFRELGIVNSNILVYIETEVGPQQVQMVESLDNSVRLRITR